MRLVRIALCSVNTTVGAVASNVDRALAVARAAAADGATLLVFPEQCVGGYPPEDLVQWRGFLDAQWNELARFARATADLGVASAIGVVAAASGLAYNCAALVHAGEVRGLVPKEKLPTYNVFYEGRTLARGAPDLHTVVGAIPFGDQVFRFDFGTVGLEVCEDLWSPDGPMRRRSFAGAEVVVNVSASPYRVGVLATRRELIATRAADNQCVLAYANLVGANDGLIFDGGGFVADSGRIVLEAPRFREGFAAVTVDLDRARRLRAENTTWRDDRERAPSWRTVRTVDVAAPTRAGEWLGYPVPEHRSFFLPAPSPPPDPRGAFCEELLDALALGVGDYFEKTGCFATIGVALSGGRDSLLTLFIARRYLERRFAHEGAVALAARVRATLRAFCLPTRYSSAATRRAAEVSAEELGVPLAIVSVDEGFERELQAVAAMLQPGETLSAAARANVQARVRAGRMWTWSNCAAGLFLQTSNMSEKAVGYSTIGGDGEGALAVIANLPKTVVNYLLAYLEEKTGSEAIRLTCAVPASAELADGQEDEKELMPFPVLDACFYLYAGEKMCPGEVARVLRALFPDEDPARLDAWCEKFARLFTQSIYKWVQAPLSLHIGNLDLERERALQLPVVQRREWQK